MTMVAEPRARLKPTIEGRIAASAGVGAKA
jgi:hypothetical protein